MSSRKTLESPFIAPNMAEIEEISKFGSTTIDFIWAKPGCEATSHIHEEGAETLYVKKGFGLIVWIDGKRYELNEGQHATCYKGQTHCWLNSSNETVQLICTKGKY